jgi:putative peptidoglycan lipid II flippase
MAQMRSTIGQAIGLMLALNVPATLGLFVLAGPIVALIFEHGNFTASDTAATALALQYYAIGLVGYSVVRIVSPGFYALHMSRVPVTASVVSVAANIALNVVLVRVMGYAGLALGTSLAAIINATIQIVLLRRKIGGIEGRRLAIGFVKIAVASVAMAVAAFVAAQWLGDWLPGRAILVQAIRVFGAIAVGLVVLATTGFILRVREFERARDLILARLGRPR